MKSAAAFQLHHHLYRSRASQGMVLVLPLIFLLMLTLLGIASLSTNMAQERMTYATADYLRAFQASDSALRQGESWLASQGHEPVACDAGCLVYPQSSTQITYRNFESSTWWNDGGNSLSFGSTYSQGTNASSLRSAADLGRIHTQPRYVMQFAGEDKGCSLGTGSWPSPPCAHYFRITAAGTGVQPQIRSYVQSIYAQIY